MSVLPKTRRNNIQVKDLTVWFNGLKFVTRHDQTLHKTLVLRAACGSRGEASAVNPKDIKVAKPNASPRVRDFVIRPSVLS